MVTLLTILHVFVCLFLIVVVLVQGGKGAELGAAFGGASQTIFGSRGAATFLSKLTTAVAVVFMLTSLLLAISSVRGTSIIKKTVPAAGRTASPGAAAGGGAAPIPATGDTPTQVPVAPTGQAAPAASAPAAPQSGAAGK